MGKLNMWQWLGVVLLIVGAVMYINRTSEEKEKAKKPAPGPGTPVTQPAPVPATQPIPALPTQPTTKPG